MRFAQIKRCFLITTSFFAIVLSAEAQNIFQEFYDYKMPSTTTVSIPNSINTNEATSTDFEYIQIVKSCDYAFRGGCVNVRAGPGTNFPSVKKLRNGVILHVKDVFELETGTWYQIDFVKENVLDKSQIQDTWFVKSTYTKPVYNVKPEWYDSNKVYGGDFKKIVVDIGKQKLYAYDIVNGKDVLYMTSKISTGLYDTPTASGEYYIFFKTPSRYMQSTTSSATNTPYDLPGVPYDMYFSEDGSAIHGTYWHNNFGRRHSHGCVNLNLADSEKLYKWAVLGTMVLIKN
jgi:lipoprotein-anchoring transpeptidase ErfK/SrfK